MIEEERENEEEKKWKHFLNSVKDTFCVEF